MMSVMNSFDPQQDQPAKRIGRTTRVAAGLGIAALFVAGCSTLGASKADGGSTPQVRTELAGNSSADGQSAFLTTLGATPQSVGSISAAAVSGSPGGQAGTTQAIGRIHQCVAAARALRASGRPAAARAMLRTCLRGFLRLRLALLGAIHGQVTFDGKNGPRTVAFERGVVQQVSSGSIVVKAPDGTVMTWDLVAKTVVVQARHRVGTSALAVNQHVLVVGPVLGGADDARLIVIH